MTDKIVVLEASLMALGFTIEKHVKEGWSIDPNMPLTQVWTNYEIGFIKESADLEENKQDNEKDEEDNIAKVFESVDTKQKSGKQAGRPKSK